MFAAAPGESVRKGEGLIELAARRGIGEAGEGSKADPGKAEIKWIGGNTGYAGLSCDVLNVGEQVRGGNVVVIVVHTKIVGGTPAAIDPAGSGIQSLEAIAPVERRKRIYQGGGIAGPIHAEVDVVLRAPATAPAATEIHEGEASRAKIVN